jgi:hypothetical protein
MSVVIASDEMREEHNVRLAGPLDAIETGLADWNDALGRVAHPHLPQSFAYGVGKAAKSWNVVRIRFEQDGELVAIAAVLELRRLGIRLVARVNRGPLFVSANPAPATIINVYAALRRRFRGPFLIASALPHGELSAELLAKAGYYRRANHGWRSGRVDLSGSEADIWAGLASTFRNRTRRSERSGATLRVSGDDQTFEWMLDRHHQNMRDKGFHAVDATFLRAMRAAAPQNVLVYQALLEGQPVAGMSVVRTASIAEYHIGWFGPEGRQINAGNFLMWNILKDQRQRGASVFDVGGMREGDGYTQFKRTMMPEEYELAGEWMSF